MNINMASTVKWSMNHTEVYELQLNYMICNICRVGGYVVLTNKFHKYKVYFPSKTLLKLIKCSKIEK